MADGFSCKTQVEHGTGRRPLHTAQVIKMALDHGPGGTPSGEPPEAGYPDVVLDGRGPRTAVILGGAAAAGALAWGLKRRFG